MTDDQTFRLVLVAAMAAYVPFQLFYRIRSRAGGEQLDRRQEGLVNLIAVRALGAAAMFGVIAFVIDPAWMAWASVPLPTAPRAVSPGWHSASGPCAVWARTSRTPSSQEASTHS